MALQKQFKRKDLKKPDPFVVLSSRFFAYYKSNKKLFVFGIALFLLAFGSAGLIKYNQGVQAGRMESLYFQMYKLWNEDRGDSLGDTIKKMQSINEKIDKGKAKQRANLLLADAYYENKQFAEAIKLYTEVQESSRGGQITYDLARVGLGNAHEGKKDFKQAIEIYKSIIDSQTDYPLFYVYLGMAQCYSQDNDTKNALLILREMMSKFPGHGEMAKVESMVKKLEEKA